MNFVNEGATLVPLAPQDLVIRSLTNPEMDTTRPWLGASLSSDLQRNSFQQVVADPAL